MLIKQSPSNEPEKSDTCSLDAATSELLINENSYQVFYENLPALCFTLDSTGRILFANQFGASCLGYRQQELISQQIFTFFHSQDLQKLRTELSVLNHRDRTSEVASWEGHLVCRDGRYLRVLAKARLLPTAIASQLTLHDSRKRGGEEKKNGVDYQLSTSHSSFPLILLICEDLNFSQPASLREREQKQRFRKQSQVLVELAKSHALEPGNLNAAVKKITQTAADTLEAERVSIWLYGDDRTQLQCIDLYERSTQQHNAEIPLSLARNSAYFQTQISDLKTGEQSAATSAQEIYKSEYFKHGIASLRLPILLSDRIEGMICFERTSTLGQWDEDEEHFATNLATFVGMAVEAWERMRLEVQRREQQQKLLSQYYEQLEDRVEERTAALKKANQQLQQEIALRKQVEAALRRQQQEQQIIFDSVPAMIWQKDQNNQIVRINKTAAAFTGCSLQELEGKLGTEFYSKAVARSAQDDLEVLNSGSPKLGIIEPLLTASGEQRWIRTDKIPYRDEAGNIVGVIVFAVEITELLRVEQELRQYRDRLEELVAERTAMYERAMRHFYWSNQQLQQEINDRLQVEAALSRERNLFIGGPVTVFRCLAQEHWPVEYVSPNIAEFGYSVEDFTNSTLRYAQVIHPDDRERVAREVQGYQEAGIASFEQDYRILTPDGESRWVCNFMTAVSNEAGDITHYEGYLLDITERKRAQAQQEQSLSLLHAILESTADGILAVDTAGEIVSCNQQFLEMWNLSPTVCQSGDWWERLTLLAQQVQHPEDFLHRVRQLYSQPETESCEIIEFNNGRFCERYTQPIRVGEVIIGRVWCFRDITEHKQAQATLSENQRRFQAIFDCSFQFIGLLTPNGIVLEANKTALDFADIALSDIVGRPFWQAHWWTISQSTQEQLRAAIARAATGEFVRYEVQMLGAGGKIATIDFSLKPIKDETGNVVLLIPEGRDITESKQAEMALRLQAEREHLIGQIQARIRSSLDLQAVLKTTVAEVRQFLQTDRVVIFHFRPDWYGEVVVESVGAGWMPILNQTIEDPCFRESYITQYQEGRIRAIEDIYQANLGLCHIQLLASFQVRANLVVPIIQSEQSLANSQLQTPQRLWGLLIAHHCSAPRRWQVWEMELLKQLATQVAIAIEQSQLYQQLQAANQELQHLASLDSLTKIANRRRFDEVLNQESQRLFVEPVRLSLILCDIDCFKTYNDTYGHQAGDACLQQVAGAIRDACRDFPPERLYFAARYGGEEFAVILPNTDMRDAVAVAEEIRRRVRALAIVHEQSTVAECVTLSLGVASTSAAGTTPTSLIAAADRALYEAKSQGRDRVAQA
ncbi:MAG: PAS domain S-box protein [Actinomycetota bacterium]